MADYVDGDGAQFLAGAAVSPLGADQDHVSLGFLGNSQDFRRRLPHADVNEHGAHRSLLASQERVETVENGRARFLVEHNTIGLSCWLLLPLALHGINENRHDMKLRRRRTNLHGALKGKLSVR